MQNNSGFIIGSGLAGPSDALFRQGADLTVAFYKARPASDGDTGVFLTIAANGMHVFGVDWEQWPEAVQP